jgi:peptide/nickel transport system permease protein
VTRGARVAATMLVLLHLAVVAAPLLAPYAPETQHRMHPYAPPGAEFPLGTDGLGRDVLSRTLFGGRVSLFAGLAAAVVAVSLGALVGGVSGLAGGRVDRTLTRTTEAVMALPWLYLLLAVRAFLPLSLGPGAAFVLVAVVIGCVGWAQPARLVRSVVLAAREHDAVRAARGFGASEWWILRRHLLPAAGGVLLTQLALLVPQFILAEVTLSFVGLGVGEPAASWGGMLAELRQPYVLRHAGWLIAPAIPLILSVFCYYRLTADHSEGRRFSWWGATSRWRIRWSR